MDDNNAETLEDFITQLSSLESIIAEYSSPESPEIFINIGGGDSNNVVAGDADTNSCNNNNVDNTPDFSYSTEIDVTDRYEFTTSF